MADNNNDAVLKVYQDRINDLQTSLETEKGDKTAIQTQLDAQVKLYTQVKTALDAKDAEIKKYQDDAREAIKTSRADTLKKFCEASVKSGLMTPAARDILADEGKRSYSDDSGIEFSFETVKEFVEAQGTLADADTENADGTPKKNKKDYTDAGIEVDARAKKYSVDNKVDYPSALTAVLEADADLAKAYIEESEGGEA